MQPRSGPFGFGHQEMLDGMSSPELLPVEHGRLSEPRDWSMVSTTSDDGGGAEGSRGGGGGGLGSGGGGRFGGSSCGSKSLEQDGEWMGDAVPAPPQVMFF